ncbi:RNA polymerase II-associated protein 3 [Leucoagaricus sp. SymC.cos]|nr:RNA polymerase II-associated protein 3 [Leucoagaricus sp. SymC.cos]
MVFSGLAIAEPDLISPRRPINQPPSENQHLKVSPLAVKRREARKTTFAHRKEEAEKLKEEGNGYFREGCYVEAIGKYNEAAKIVGQRPVIMSNLAVAYLKLEQYEFAEWASDCALLYSPRMAKARFRRALARKGLGMNKGAELDLLVITKHYSEITEAQDELVKVRWQKKKNGDGERAESDYDEEYPPYDGEEWDPPLESDSEEAKHTGNGRACKFHNRGGCNKGSKCSFSHAPDDKSVRDELGQNVCIDYLLGKCKQGPNCSYAHMVTYLLDGWWSSLKEVCAAKKLRAAMNDSSTDAHTINTLENTSIYGRLKKARDYRSDLNLYSALPPDVLKSRLKDKGCNKASSSANASPENDPFILILCLEDEEMFNNINGHLLKALRTKLRVVRARSSTQALTYLDAPELAGVIVADAGIVDRTNSNVVPKLVDFVKGGGSIVFGCLFPSFVASSAFRRFFSQNFGLNWQYGSYFRTTFFKNPGNDLVKKNPSLSDSYSMKALHVQGIPAASALYKANESSRTQSLVFPSTSVSDFDESPAVTTRFGSGFVSFLGDVNAEESSTKTILAMVGLLDAPPPSLPMVPRVETPEEAQTATPKKAGGKKKSGKKKKNSPQIPLPSPTPSASVESSTSSRNIVTSYSPYDKRFIMQLTLEYGGVVDNVVKQQLDAIQVKMNIKKVTSESRAIELLSSPHLCGIFATDPGLTNPEHAKLLKELVGYVYGGGCLVFGGTFGSFVQFPDLEPLFSEFDLHWSAGSYTRESLETNLNENELVETNLFLPNKISIKALFLSGVEIEDMVYTTSSGSGYAQDQSAIAFSNVNKGHVGYIGDVNADSCTTPSILAMFDLLKPRRTATKPLPHKFLLVLTHFDTIEEYEQTPLFRELKEKDVDIITDERLSDPRLADLLSSRDLLAVLVLDDMFSVPEREWLGHQVAAYAWSGGTVIFGGDFGVMTPPDEFERFLSDNFCLPWKISSATELTVKLNGDNRLIRTLPYAAQQESVNSGGAFIYDVGPEAMVYRSQPGLGPERTTHVPVAYADVGKGHVAYFGHEEITELDATLMLAMMRL